MSDYYTIPTTLGAAKLAAAANTNQALTLSHMAFGDANGVPYLPNSRVNAIALVNERYRIAVQYVIQDTENPNVYIIKARIPANIGGFEICEIGIFDTNGELIYLANYPRTFKPQITQGAGGELTIKLHVITSQTNTISIILDPHVITLTQEEGDNRYALKTELAAEVQNLVSEDTRIESDRVNQDLALSIALAVEITNRENGLAQLLDGFSSATPDPVLANSGNGHIKLPDSLGGFIIQWGWSSTDVSHKSISYHVPFPNKLLNLQVTPIGVDASLIHIILSGDTFIFSIAAHGIDNASIQFYWLAIGC